MKLKEKLDTITYQFYKHLPPVLYPVFLKIIYKNRTGRTLNLENPKRISEKIQWLKLHDNLPIKAVLADKLRVREWVRKRVDNLNFPHIYGIWNSFEEVDFDILPETFYLKTNHGAAMNIQVIRKKHFIGRAREKASKLFDKWLKTNFAFLWGFELQYKDIKPQVYAEERLYVGEHQRLADYKIWCMNGKAKFIEFFVYPQKYEPENIRMVIYDTEWNKLPFTHDIAQHEGELPPPSRLSEMISTAEKLAQDFKLVRVDINEVRGKLYFGELTFTPCSGHMTFIPDEYDLLIGDMLDLK